MKKLEMEDRIRLLEYENAILKHKMSEFEKRLIIPIKPLPPFAIVEIHNGFLKPHQLPTYEELKQKYKVI